MSMQSILAWTLLVISVLTMSWVPVHGLNCTSRSERADAYEVCFQDAGLDAGDIIGWYRNQDGDVEDVPSLQLYQTYGNQFCMNRTTFKEAVTCTTAIDIECSSDEAKAVMPTAVEQALAVDRMCAALTNLNLTCVESNMDNLAACAETKASELTKAKTVQDLKCIFMRIAYECAKKVYKPCGCATSITYSDIAADIYKPGSCPKATRRVVCDPLKPQKFVSDGLNDGSRLTITLGLLVISALVAKLV